MYDCNHAFLTAKETGNFLRVSQSYIYHLIYANELPAIKVGYFWRIPVSHLNQYIEQQLNTPKS